ncbi:MAG: TetR/AcrR family transcriptional regulator [Actinomycetota bacterium]
MSESDETDGPPLDGRSARRQRNVDAVLDVVLEMFQEEAVTPTMEQVAARSGLSLRSLYRYFADPSEMFEATVQRTLRRALAVATIEKLGEGPFEARLATFVKSRLDLHEGYGAVQQATLVHALQLTAARDQVERTRMGLREQFVRQFAPELADREPHERERITAAADVLTQLESIRYLRNHRGFSLPETRAVLLESVRALLTHPSA